MKEYESNSHRSKEEQKKTAPEKNVQKVVAGNVKVKKKSGVDKFAKLFIAKDVEDVGTYLLTDVFIPFAKDTVIKAFEALFYGEVRGGSGRGSTNVSRVSYQKYYDDRDGRRRETSPYRNRTVIDYDNLVFENRGDAERILKELANLIYQYDTASVFDLYEMAGQTPDSTTKKFGWTDVSSARVDLTRDGYVIRLPKARPLDD